MQLQFKLLSAISLTKRTYSPLPSGSQQQVLLEYGMLLGRWAPVLAIGRRYLYVRWLRWLH